MATIAWNIPLPFEFKVAAVQTDKNPTLDVCLQGSDYRITLPKPEWSNLSQIGELMIWPCNVVHLQTECPDVDVRGKDEKVDTAKAEEIIEQESPLVFTALNLLLTGIRYLTRQLQVHPLTHEQFDRSVSVRVSQDVATPGFEITPPRTILVDYPSPPNAEEIEKFVTSETDIRLPEKLLYDAYGFLELSHDVRRAILEAAIAAEALIRTYLSSKGISVPDDSKLGRGVVTLFDRDLLKADNRSLKSMDENKYRNLDHLFRTRNKVVHGAGCGYKDDGGTWHSVGVQETTDFLQTVRWVLNWLSGIKIAEHPQALRME